MKFDKPHNPNYAATVVALQTFVDFPNCDNVKGALVFGSQVIVSKEVEAGTIGVFFPVETQLLKEFLSHNNLYRKPEWGNADPSKVGFFEEHGRVKCVKFRGHKSEGFWLPLECLGYLGYGLEEYKVGDVFDCVGARPVCKKYIPRFQSVVGSEKKHSRQPKPEDRIVKGQFAFHVDTENLRRNIDKIHPDMWISITDKWHGTSAVFANVLVERSLGWFQKLLKHWGIPIQTQEYGFTWASRRVVKGVGGEIKPNTQNFYKEDIWSVVAREIQERIPKGYTVYGEIVGYTPNGQPIQKGYHYGCVTREHRFLVYRVTITNPDGRVVDLGWNQLKQFCSMYGFDHVMELWFGKAKDLIKVDYGVDIKEWQKMFLGFLEKNFTQDQLCGCNNLEVPAEGIVVRADKLDEFLAFKLKNFKFLERETKLIDKGDVDMEVMEEMSNETTT